MRDFNQHEREALRTLGYKLNNFMFISRQYDYFKCEEIKTEKIFVIRY